MPRVEVNFEDVDSPVPAALYPFEITGSKFQATKSDGSDMIAWQLTLTKPGENYGRRVVFYSNLANKKMIDTPEGPKKDVDAERRGNYFLREFLKTVKAPWDKSGFATEDAHHCKGIAKVEIHKGDDGREMNRVNTIFEYTEESAAAANAA